MERCSMKRWMVERCVANKFILEIVTFMYMLFALMFTCFKRYTCLE